MSQLKDTLIKWAQELKQFKGPDWNSLPDLDLYMDQVITYLERQVSTFSQPADEKLITPAMINNYVKNGVIPRPVKKKYSREHLVHLMAVLSLKQVLPLAEISELTMLLTSVKSPEEFLDELNIIQNQALCQASDTVQEFLEKIETDSEQNQTIQKLSTMALKLSLEANARSLISKRILNEIESLKSKQECNKEGCKEKEKQRKKETNNE